jgi:hypothetical protein
MSGQRIRRTNLFFCGSTEGPMQTSCRSSYSNSKPLAEHSLSHPQWSLDEIARRGPRHESCPPSRRPAPRGRPQPGGAVDGGLLSFGSMENPSPGVQGHGGRVDFSGGRMVEKALPRKRPGLMVRAVLVVAFALSILALFRAPVSTCGACAGSGQFPKAQMACKLCDGTGHIGSFPARRTIDRVLDLLWNWW